MANMNLLDEASDTVQEFGSAEEATSAIRGGGHRVAGQAEVPLMITDQATGGEKAYYVSPTEASYFIGKGARLIDDEELRAYKDEIKYEDSGFLAGLLGVLDAPFLGTEAASRGLGMIGLPTREIVKQNRGYHMFGDMLASTILASAAGGPVGAAAGAARVRTALNAQKLAQSGRVTQAAADALDMGKAAYRGLVSTAKPAARFTSPYWTAKMADRISGGVSHTAGLVAASTGIATGSSGASNVVKAIGGLTSRGIGVGIEAGIYGAGYAASEADWGNFDESAAFVATSASKSALAGVAFVGVLGTVGPLAIGAGALGLKGADKSWDWFVKSDIARKAETFIARVDIKTNPKPGIKDSPAELAKREKQYHLGKIGQKAREQNFEIVQAFEELRDEIVDVADGLNNQEEVVRNVDQLGLRVSVIEAMMAPNSGANTVEALEGTVDLIERLRKNIKLIMGGEQGTVFLDEIDVSPEEWVKAQRKLKTPDDEPAITEQVQGENIHRMRDMLNQLDLFEGELVNKAVRSFLRQGGTPGPRVVDGELVDIPEGAMPSEKFEIKLRNHLAAFANDHGIDPNHINFEFRTIDDDLAREMDPRHIDGDRLPPSVKTETTRPDGTVVHNIYIDRAKIANDLKAGEQPWLNPIEGVLPILLRKDPDNWVGYLLQHELNHIAFPENTFMDNLNREVAQHALNIDLSEIRNESALNQIMEKLSLLHTVRGKIQGLEASEGGGRYVQDIYVPDAEAGFRESDELTRLRTKQEELELEISDIYYSHESRTAPPAEQAPPPIDPEDLQEIHDLVGARNDELIAEYEPLKLRKIEAQRHFDEINEEVIKARGQRDAVKAHMLEQDRDRIASLLKNIDEEMTDLLYRPKPKAKPAEDIDIDQFDVDDTEVRILQHAQSKLLEDGIYSDPYDHTAETIDSLLYQGDDTIIYDEVSPPAEYAQERGIKTNGDYIEERLKDAVLSRSPGYSPKQTRTQWEKLEAERVDLIHQLQSQLGPVRPGVASVDVMEETAGFITLLKTEVRKAQSNRQGSLKALKETSKRFESLKQKINDKEVSAGHEITRIPSIDSELSKDGRVSPTSELDEHSPVFLSLAYGGIDSRANPRISESDLNEARELLVKNAEMYYLLFHSEKIFSSSRRNLDVALSTMGALTESKAARERIPYRETLSDADIREKKDRLDYLSEAIAYEKQRYFPELPLTKADTVDAIKAKTDELGGYEKRWSAEEMDAYTDGIRVRETLRAETARLLEDYDRVMLDREAIKERLFPRVWERTREDVYNVQTDDLKHAREQFRALEKRSQELRNDIIGQLEIYHNEAPKEVKALVEETFGISKEIGLKKTQMRTKQREVNNKEELLGHYRFALGKTENPGQQTMIKNNIAEVSNQIADLKAQAEHQWMDIKEQKTLLLKKQNEVIVGLKRDLTPKEIDTRIDQLQRNLQSRSLTEGEISQTVIKLKRLKANKTRMNRGKVFKSEMRENVAKRKTQSQKEMKALKRSQRDLKMELGEIRDKRKDLTTSELYSTDHYLREMQDLSAKEEVLIQDHYDSQTRDRKSIQGLTDRIEFLEKGSYYGDTLPGSIPPGSGKSRMGILDYEIKVLNRHLHSFDTRTPDRIPLWDDDGNLLRPMTRRDFSPEELRLGKASRMKAEPSDPGILKQHEFDVPDELRLAEDFSPEDIKKGYVARLKKHEVTPERGKPYEKTLPERFEIPERFLVEETSPRISQHTGEPLKLRYSRADYENFLNKKALDDLNRFDIFKERRHTTAFDQRFAEEAGKMGLSGLIKLLKEPGGRPDWLNPEISSFIFDFFQKYASKAHIDLKTRTIRDNDASRGGLDSIKENIRYFLSGELKKPPEVTELPGLETRAEPYNAFGDNLNTLKSHYDAVMRRRDEAYKNFTRKFMVESAPDDPLSKGVNIPAIDDFVSNITHVNKEEQLKILLEYVSSTKEVLNMVRRITDIQNAPMLKLPNGQRENRYRYLIKEIMALRRVEKSLNRKLKFLQNETADALDWAQVMNREYQTSDVSSGAKGVLGWGTIGGAAGWALGGPMLAGPAAMLGAAASTIRHAASNPRLALVKLRTLEVMIKEGRKVVDSSLDDFFEGMVATERDAGGWRVPKERLEKSRFPRALTSNALAQVMRSEFKPTDAGEAKYSNGENFTAKEFANVETILGAIESNPDTKEEALAFVLKPVYEVAPKTGEALKLNMGESLSRTYRKMPERIRSTNSYESDYPPSDSDLLKFGDVLAIEERGVREILDLSREGVLTHQNVKDAFEADPYGMMRYAQRIDEIRSDPDGWARVPAFMKAQFEMIIGSSMVNTGLFQGTYALMKEAAQGAGGGPSGSSLTIPKGETMVGILERNA